MARQRKATRLHEIQGTMTAARRRDRAQEPEGVGELGAAPKGWDKAGRELWVELATQVPAGVARQNDRAAFELLCLLWADIRSDPTNVIPAMSAQFRAMLASFGMTPASRAALSVPPSLKSDDPASKFFDEL